MLFFLLRLGPLQRSEAKSKIAYRIFGSGIKPQESKIRNLKITDILAICDTREKTPLNLAPLKTIRKGLPTGDYSVENLETRITVERKSLADFIMCCTHERIRFENEIERMKSFEYAAIVIESTWSAIELKQYRGNASPTAILGSAMGFALSAKVPIIMAGSHHTAGKLVARLLYVAANRIHRQQNSLQPIEKKV